MFSVLTPVYNPPIRALSDAIESVRRQSFTDWELILVDDGSTDPAVRGVLDTAAASDRRIKAIYRAANGGISASSQTALDAATGQFTALLDRRRARRRLHLYR
jgi:glycosyltransferase involved in cell wall biosynthesis